MEDFHTIPTTVLKLSGFTLQSSLVIMRLSGSTTSNSVISDAGYIQYDAVFAARSMLHHECNMGFTISFAFRHFDSSR